MVITFRSSGCVEIFIDKVSGAREKDLGLKKHFDSFEKEIPLSCGDKIFFGNNLYRGEWENQ